MSKPWTLTILFWPAKIEVTSARRDLAPNTAEKTGCTKELPRGKCEQHSCLLSPCFILTTHARHSYKAGARRLAELKDSDLSYCVAKVRRMWVRRCVRECVRTVNGFTTQARTALHFSSSRHRAKICNWKPRKNSTPPVKLVFQIKSRVDK